MRTWIDRGDNVEPASSMISIADRRGHTSGVAGSTSASASTCSVKRMEVVPTMILATMPAQTSHRYHRNHLSSSAAAVLAGDIELS